MACEAVSVTFGLGPGKVSYFRLGAPRLTLATLGRPRLTFQSLETANVIFITPTIKSKYLSIA